MKRALALSLALTLAGGLAVADAFTMSPASASASTSPIDSPVTTEDQIGTDSAPDAEIPVAAASEEGAQPMAVGGPDGVTAPFLFWNVEDEDGNPVGGATFVLRYWGGTSWQLPTAGSAFGYDCTTAGCLDSGGKRLLDRDADPGEYAIMSQAEGVWATTPSPLVVGRNYAATPNVAPMGYEWVDTTPHSIAPQGVVTTTWNNAFGTNTHDFGTFVVRKIAANPAVCVAPDGSDYIYGVVQSTGEILQVNTTTGQVQTFSPAPPKNTTTDTFNGLGLGAGGEFAVIFQLNMAGNAVSTIRDFDPVTQQWTSRQVNITTSGHDRVAFVAGAINPVDGNYYFGGFWNPTDAPALAGSQFRLWKFDGDVTYMGAIETGRLDPLGSNGDLAFDGSGNLFVMQRPSGGQPSMISVTAAEVSAADGTAIAGQVSQDMGDALTAAGFGGPFNGVAFGSGGSIYFADLNTMGRADLPGWANPEIVVPFGGMNSSADLASCAPLESVPTITIQKEVVGERVQAGDQFELTLSSDGSLVSSVETAGSASGLQAEKVGPFPVTRGTVLTFAEAAAGTTDLADYTSRYECTADGHPLSPTVSGSGTSGFLTVPETGTAFVCTFANTPLAELEIEKTSDPAPGTVLSPGQEVTYTLTFRNTGGSDVVVNEEDALADVLDDAELIGPISADAPLTATIDGAGDRIAITGTLAAHTTRTVSYAVRVDDPLTGDATLRNYVVPAGDDPPETCEPGEPCTEHPVRLDLSWNKIDQVGTLLAGSEWTLTPLDSDGDPIDADAIAVVDCVSGAAEDCTGPDTDPASGKFLVAGLVPGTYVLTETKAPAGFVLLADEIEIVMNSNVAFGDIVNEQIDVPGLPLTGGVGTLGFLLGAGGLGALALVGLMIQRRRNRHGLTT